MSLEQELKECKQALECCKRQFEQVKIDNNRYKLANHTLLSELKECKAEKKRMGKNYQHWYDKWDEQRNRLNEENERLRGIIEEIQRLYKNESDYVLITCPCCNKKIRYCHRVGETWHQTNGSKYNNMILNKDLNKFIESLEEGVKDV